MEVALAYPIASEQVFTLQVLAGLYADWFQYSPRPQLPTGRAAPSETFRKSLALWGI
jgi:hypothetical protein